MAGPYLGVCIPCQCNGRADRCDPVTGKCIVSQMNHGDDNDSRGDDDDSGGDENDCGGDEGCNDYDDGSDDDAMMW